MAVSPAKGEKIGTLKGFSDHQQLFAHAVEAACEEHLSLRVCSAPVNLVTPDWRMLFVVFCEHTPNNGRTQSPRKQGR
jgi:hypothetical protein